MDTFNFATLSTPLTALDTILVVATGSAPDQNCAGMSIYNNGAGLTLITSSINQQWHMLDAKIHQAFGTGTMTLGLNGGSGNAAVSYVTNSFTFASNWVIALRSVGGVSGAYQWTWTISILRGQ